jgi:hypothetical protein
MRNNLSVATPDFPTRPRKPKKRKTSTKTMPERIARTAVGIGFTTGGLLYSDKLTSLA